jgi:hypothetical protein
MAQFALQKFTMSPMGHSLQVRPRPLVHKCPLCINTDRKFWALGFVAMCQEATYASQQNRAVIRSRRLRAAREIQPTLQLDCAE